MTETNAQEIMRRLAEPFAGPVVKWRVQGKPTERGGKFYARAVCYVDARIVIDRLNDVLGFDWETQTIETGKGRTLCRLGITINGVTRWRDDGAGDTDIEGEKGSISDALKRAAVRFGIGAYLYALPSPRVEVDAREKDGRVYVSGIKEHDRERLADLAQRSLSQWEAALKAIDAQADDGEAPRKQDRAADPPRDSTAPREVKENTSQPKSDAATKPRRASAKKLEEFRDRALAAIEAAKDQAALDDVYMKATTSPIWAQIKEEKSPFAGEINKAAIARRASFVAAESASDAQEDRQPAKRAPADKNGVRKIPAPKVKSQRAWEEWGADLAAAIRAAPNRAAAEAIFDAHEVEMLDCSTHAEKDVKEWARGRIEKYHPHNKQEAGGRSR